MNIAQKQKRNFSIIAHIDHGKSTLSDRIISLCQGLSDREMRAQVLDSMDIERERGITIKAQTVTLNYTAKDGKTYELNLIDTPGHVDFAYEVSRSLAACEGAVLLVDASQGVEAQTLANCYTALDFNMDVIPVLNKIDLIQSEPERVCKEIEDIIGIDTTDIIKVSGKTGAGVDELLERIIETVPAPNGDANESLQALIMDSWFDPYLGIVSLIKIQNGNLKLGDKVTIKSNNQAHTVEKIGVFTPKKLFKKELNCGEVGFLICNAKDIHSMPVGDTIVFTKKTETPSLPGFKKVQPKVYAGIFPTEPHQFELFRESLEKLSLNDASLHFEPENSDALGPGFRCGFLGLLHMEIIQERLEREYDLDIITTAPNVIYKVVFKDGEIMEIYNPSKLPEVSKVENILEPIADVNILVPEEYLGNIITLCIEKRGIQQNMVFSGRQVNLHFEIPMNEVVLDFFDKVKAMSKGYASMDYELLKFESADLIKMDILINHNKVDALSLIVHRSKSASSGRKIIAKLKELIPKQMYEIAIQAAIGSKIIARESISAYRKNVTAKCYGGDISRKKKLLQKQKAGKKRMKKLGNVDVPQAAFLSVLRIDD